MKKEPETVPYYGIFRADKAAYEEWHFKRLMECAVNFKIPEPEKKEK